MSGEFKGDRYEGEFRNGEKSGKWIYYWNNGYKYEGDYKDDKINGKGIYCWPNGDWIEGEYGHIQINNRIIIIIIIYTPSLVC